MIVNTNTDKLEAGQRFLVTETNGFDKALLSSVGIDLHDRPFHLRRLTTDGRDLVDPKEHLFLTSVEFRDLVVPTGDGSPQVIVK